MTSFDKNYVLITGATSGIGYELAKIFAGHGYNLIIVARTLEQLSLVSAELCEEYCIEVVAIPKDLFLKESPFELYQEISDKGLQVDILVNNAGQGLYGRFVDTDIDDELDIVQLNVNASVILTKLFLSDMVDNSYGRILNVTSIASKVPGPYQAVYHGTQAFVHSFTEAIRAETADTGIAITSLLAGATDTDFFRKAGMQDSKILDHGLADAATVAMDGFNALMEGVDMMVSGFKNKAQVAMSNVIPDSAVARQMLKQQSPRHPIPRKV